MVYVQLRVSYFLSDLMNFSYLFSFFLVQFETKKKKKKENLAVEEVVFAINEPPFR